MTAFKYFLGMVLVCYSLSFAVAKSDVTFESFDGTSISGEFYEAQEAKAFVLVVHGLQSHAGWYLGGQANAEAGISSFAFDRRGSGLSSGMRGHAKSVDDFMQDFDAAMNFVKSKNLQNLPVHIMANSLGAVVSLNYLSKGNQDVASLILTTPGTHSTKQGDYSLLAKLRILTAPATEYFETPLENSDFVDPGPYLDWINADSLGTRQFTAAFLRSVNSMKSNVEEAIESLNIPLFVLLANQDAIIDNAAVEKEVFEPYNGTKQLKKYDSKHYLFFGSDKEHVSADIQDWILD